MKTSTFFLLLVLVVLIFFVYRYYNSTKKIKSILFIGDSNTVPDFSYADQLKQIDPSLNIKKIAQNGANTDWMLEQMKNELAVNKYDAVSILGGSNDIYGKGEIDSAKSNLNKMYLLVKSKGMKVIAVTPPNKNWYVNRTDQKQQLLSDLINWISNNPLKNYYIDFWSMTNNQNFFTSADGYLHPQSQAHNILANTLYNLIK